MKDEKAFTAGDSRDFEPTPRWQRAIAYVVVAGFFVFLLFLAAMCALAIWDWVNP